MQACWATIALALNTVQAWHSSRGPSISSLDAMRYGLSGPCSRSKVLQTAQTVLRFPSRPAGIPLVRQLVTHLTWLHHLLTRTMLLMQAYEMPFGDMSVLEPFIGGLSAAAVSHIVGAWDSARHGNAGRRNPKVWPALQKNSASLAYPGGCVRGGLWSR